MGYAVMGIDYEKLKKYISDIIDQTLSQLLTSDSSSLASINQNIYNRLPMLPILTPYPLTNLSAKFYGSWSKGFAVDSPTGYNIGSNDTSTPGALEVIFYGKRFVIALQYGPPRGIANIYVDGNLIDQVDCYDINYRWVQKYYELDEDGEHTLRIEVSGQKNENSSDYYIYIGGLYFEGDKNINSPYVRQFGDIYNYLNYIRNYGLINPLYATLTTTPLANGSSYVSSWEDRQSYGFSYIIVLVYADTDCDVYVEQSHDGSTVIRSDHLGYTGGSTSGNLLKVQLMARYVRVRVENNSGTDQTTLVVTRRYSMA